MAPLPVRQYHDAGAQFADFHRQGHARGNVVFETRVGKMHILALRDQHQPRRYFGLGYSLLRRAARAHIAGSEVEHPGAVSHLRHPDERAAAGLLDIVRMRGQGQHVEAHERASSFRSSSSTVTRYLKAFEPLIAITGTSSL